MRATTACTLSFFGLLFATMSHATSFTQTMVNHSTATNTDSAVIDNANMIGNVHLVGESGSFPSRRDTVDEVSSWKIVSRRTATTTHLINVGDDTVVGECLPNWTDQNGVYANLYDVTSWSAVAYSGAHKTDLAAIKDTKIVGYDANSNGNRFGSVYDGTTWTSHDHLNAAQTLLNGTDGDNIFGFYLVGADVLGAGYGGTTWTRNDYSDLGSGYRYNIDDGNVIGYDSALPRKGEVIYFTSNGILESATLLLALFGLPLLPLGRRK